MKEMNTIGDLIDFMLEDRKKMKDYAQEVKSKVNPKYNVTYVGIMFYLSFEKKEPHYSVRFDIQEENKKETTQVSYSRMNSEQNIETTIEKEFYEDNKELITTTLDKLYSNFEPFISNSADFRNYKLTKFKLDDSHRGEIDFFTVELYRNTEKYPIFKYHYDMKDSISEILLNILRDTPIEITEPSMILQKANLNNIVNETEQDYDKISNKIKKL